MEKGIWPFRDCATPDEFLKKVRAELPYRYSVWSPSWFIDGHHMTLHVTLRVEGGPRRKASSYPFDPNELMTAGSWHREEARDAKIRSFVGFEHMQSGGGNGGLHDYTAYLRVDLKRLPVIKKRWETAARLAKDRTGMLAEDTVNVGHRASIRAFEEAIRLREVELKERHKKKFAKDYKAVAWLPGEW